MVAILKKRNSMLGKDRKHGIKELLEEANNVRVSDLSKRFEVTEETIRRDLEQLERAGFLLRTHGGAVLHKREGFEPPVLQRESINIEEKKLIGEHAASMVADGDVIALDASTTCLQLARNLTFSNLTVITYSLAIATELIKKPEINVLLTGGYFDRDAMATSGTPAEKMLEGYHIDKFFFSCQGFDLERGVSEPYETHVRLKQKIISISDRLFLLADSSKYEKKSLVRLLELEKIDHLVTDRQFPASAVANLESKGIMVTFAE